MENPIITDIVNYIAKKLNYEYGYCGVASGKNQVVINSGKDTNIIIIIKEEDD